VILLVIHGLYDPKGDKTLDQLGVQAALGCHIVETERGASAIDRLPPHDHLSIPLLHPYLLPLSFGL
jgi:hypothetical protein